VRLGKSTLGWAAAGHTIAGVQTITPYLLYDDAAAALDFLSRAFGFEEKKRMTTPDGRVVHAPPQPG
jgi:hypothetical protein